jgi:hypothetical protein
MINSTVAKVVDGRQGNFLKPVIFAGLESRTPNTLFLFELGTGKSPNPQTG